MLDSDELPVPATSRAEYLPLMAGAHHSPPFWDVEASRSGAGDLDERTAGSRATIDRELVAAFLAALPGSRLEPQVGERGGDVLGVVLDNDRAGWLVAAPGAPIGPAYSRVDLGQWRIQEVASARATAVPEHVLAAQASETAPWRTTIRLRKTLREVERHLDLSDESAVLRYRWHLPVGENVQRLRDAATLVVAVNDGQDKARLREFLSQLWRRFNANPAVSADHRGRRAVAASEHRRERRVRSGHLVARDAV